MFVYIQTERAGKDDCDLYTVGHYSPSGEWEPESDWGTAEEAAARCHYLNGGRDEALRAALVQAANDLGQAEEDATNEGGANSAQARFFRDCRKKARAALDKSR